MYIDVLRSDGNVPQDHVLERSGASGCITSAVPLSQFLGPDRIDAEARGVTRDLAIYEGFSRYKSISF